MASALTVLRQRPLVELDVGFVIPSAKVTAMTASTFTAADFFQNSNLSADHLQVKNAGVYRGGSATAADNWRPGGTLANSTGVVSQVGGNWSDTTADEIEIWYYGPRPDYEILKSLNRVLEFRYVTTYLALSHLSTLDGDMALSTDSNWTDVGTLGTSAKATTAALTPWGQRSYHTINNAVADSGTRSASIRVRTSGRVSAYTIAASEVGTSSLQGYSNTGSAVFGTAVTSGERRPQLLCFRNESVPSTAELVSINLTNTSSTGDTYWNQAWLYNLDNPVCPLPALLSESFMAPVILQGWPQYPTGTGSYDAEGIDWRPLTEGVDFWYVIAHGDASPYKVRFKDTSYFDKPLMVEARVPLSSFGALSAEADTTSGPLHEIVPAFKKDLLETVYNVGSRRHPDWERQYNIAQAQLTKASQARPIESVAPAKPWYAPMLNAG